jgi:hypothetical protein
LNAAILADLRRKRKHPLLLANDPLQIDCSAGVDGGMSGCYLFEVAPDPRLMAKKNIYIPDRIYRSMSAEAEKRGISFSHACSLAFLCWLDTVRQVRSSVDRSYGAKKDPSGDR